MKPEKLIDLKKSKQLALFTSIVSTGAYLLTYPMTWYATSPKAVISAGVVGIGMGILALFSLGYYSFVTIYIKKRIEK